MKIEIRSLCIVAKRCKIEHVDKIQDYPPTTVSSVGSCALLILFQVIFVGLITVFSNPIENRHDHKWFVLQHRNNIFAQNFVTFQSYVYPLLLGRRCYRIGGLFRSLCLFASATTLCIVAKRCKIGLWCVWKSNMNVESTFRWYHFRPYRSTLPPPTPSWGGGRIGQA